MLNKSARETKMTLRECVKKLLINFSSVYFTVLLPVLYTTYVIRIYYCMTYNAWYLFQIPILLSSSRNTFGIWSRRDGGSIFLVIESWNLIYNILYVYILHPRQDYFELWMWKKEDRMHIGIYNLHIKRIYTII